MKKSVWLLAIFMAFVSGSACLAQNGRSELIRSEKLNFRLDTIVTGLKVPWGMAFLPNGDILVTERQGRLRLVQNGRLHPEPIKGVPEVWANGQGGLLDLELHPQYETNGWIYLSYSGPAQKGEKGSGANTTFIRARLQNHQLVDQEVLLRAQPNYNRGVHFGGRIEFDRQGYVYLSIGDRGGRSENQTLNNYRGKVFRLHDDGRIPADNPFVNVPGAVKATFTYGHRNPQGLALNPQTGEMWEHEHGPRGGDEVNILRKGNNYGWPTITYGINYNGTIITRDTVKEGMEQPVLFWRPSIAPCGMDFVSSQRYGPWKGNLLVGSLKYAQLRRCEIQGDRIVHQESLLQGIGRVRSVKEAPDGYLYLAVEVSGMIVRLLPEE